MNAKKSIHLKRFDNFSSFYNYLPTNKLLNSKGVDVATFPYDKDDLTEYPLNTDSLNLESVNGVTHFKQFYASSGNTQHRILVYGSDKKVYINQMFKQDTGLYWLYSLTFDSAPITLAYKKDDLDSIILTSKNEMKIWQTGYSPYTVENVPIITSMCMNEGVLFCTIQEPAFKIWYATDLNPETVGNISKNSGYISLEDDLGYARKIITFDQDVYVFRDYGISKINFIKNKATVTEIYQSQTKIYSNTVNNCGNIVMFMTGEGLYTFNGVKVSKTSIEIKELLTSQNDNAVATSLADNYYLALRLNFNDGKKIMCENEDYVNNAILVFNTSNFSYEIIRGVDVKSLYTLKTELCEKVLLTFNTQHKTKLGQIIDSSTCFGEPLVKYWSSGNIIDGYNPKIITKLEVLADKDVKFNLICDGKNISFTTYKSGINKFCFKLYAKQLQLAISSSSASAQVEDAVLEYYDN